jgi:ABC-type amino acid transport substrate-binding protein
MPRLTRGVLFVAVVLFSGAAALACGDKLLAIGRGLRFQRVYAAHEANLLIYSPLARSGATLSSTKLQSTLKRAVHNLKMVQGDSELDEALKSGKFDVVLVELADLGDIKRHLQSAPSKPVILPILIKPSKAELAAAQKDYKFALKATSDDFEYLSAIDEAMKVRLRTGARS